MGKSHAAMCQVAAAVVVASAVVAVGVRMVVVAATAVMAAVVGVVGVVAAIVIVVAGVMALVAVVAVAAEDSVIEIKLHLAKWCPGEAPHVVHGAHGLLLWLKEAAFSRKYYFARSAPQSRLWCSPS